MIRVLEVLATLKRAGAENMAVSLACRLDRARFEVEVVSLYDAFEGGLEPVLAGCGVAVGHLGKRRGLDARMWPRLARAIREFSPAVVHTHSYVLRYAWPAALAAGRPRIVHTVHNVAAREVDRTGQAIHRAAFRAGVVPVAVADEVAKSFEKMYGFAPAATISNGIDMAAYRRGAERREWRAANGFDNHELLVVSVARLEPQKNPVRLVEAFAAVGAGRLLLAGDGSLRAAVEGREGVHVLGVRSDVAAMLAACDVFALASDWEGHPLSVMEAMAAGLPVVATAVGGVPEIVGDAGLLVAPEDTAGLASALRRVLTDEGLRRELGRRSLARAARFDVGEMVARYQELFERVTRP